VSERGTRLLEEAKEQIDELSGLLSRGGEAAIRRPCPGRGRLGDGTVGATASHTAQNYRRVARFVEGAPQPPHRDIAIGHAAEERAHDVTLDELLAQLTAAMGALGILAGLSDEQLDAVPPETAMRFANGQRTLEHVVLSVLKHQRHQIDAIAAALDPT
jgi:hypothetical protein